MQRSPENAARDIAALDGLGACGPLPPGSAGKAKDPRCGGLLRQYFSEPTRAYAAQVGDLADNVYRADCQGLDPEDFYAWRPVLLRSANTEFTGYSSARPDDIQRV